MVEHMRPTDQCVDDLFQFILKHPNAWIHSHCYVTKRSTTALVIADMLYNAHQVSFEDILYRSKAIGGSDLMKVPDASSRKHLEAKALVDFLKNFHLYCKTENPQQNPKAKSWQEWLKTI